MRQLECSVLLERDDEIAVWVGHCLDLDLISQGETAQQAEALLKEAMQMFISEGELFTAEELQTRRAPEEYWEQFARAQVVQLEDVRATSIEIQLADTMAEQEILREAIDQHLAKTLAP